jgi:hypothetical protein
MKEIPDPAVHPQLCRPILAGLPRVLSVNVRSGPSGRWLEDSILRLVEEVGSHQPGSQAVLAKLSDALFVETLRQYVGGLPAEETGWLAGSRDEVVGKSLAILRSRVDHPWTIAETFQGSGDVTLGSAGALLPLLVRASHGVSHAVEIATGCTQAHVHAAKCCANLGRSRLRIRGSFQPGVQAPIRQPPCEVPAGKPNRANRRGRQVQLARQTRTLAGLVVGQKTESSPPHTTCDCTD